MHNEIKNLNEQYKVNIFSTRIRGRKDFAAEQKIKDKTLRDN